MTTAALGRACPACGGSLRAWTMGSITVDGCDGCGGVWFDQDELRSVAGLPGEPVDALTATFVPVLSNAAGGGDGRCPVDGAPLAAHHFKQADEVQVLACPQCRGLWLGHGELAALAARLPHHGGGASARSSAVAGMTAATGLLQGHRCPHCGTLNPDLAERCGECRLKLDTAPPPREDDQVDIHRYTVGAAMRQVVTLLVVLGLLYYRDYRGWPVPIAVELSPDNPALPAWIVIGIWLLRWPFKTYRVDLRPDGILLHRLYMRKFVPWGSIRAQYMLDLRDPDERPSHYGVYGLSKPLVPLGPPRSNEQALGRLRPGGGRALIVLYTTRGVVTIGPDFDRHWELVWRIRDHR